MINKTTSSSHLYVWVDGSPKRIAIVYEQDGKVDIDVRELYDKATSNQAEYIALIVALESQRVAVNSTVPVNIFSDSELMVKQIHGWYNVKNAHLKDLYSIAHESLTKLDFVTLSWVPREENRAGKVLEGMK